MTTPMGNDPDLHPGGPPLSVATRFVARAIRTSRDAEQAACDFLRANGFPDAALTPDGADGGIDVVSAYLVGQVKAQVKPIGRPDLQQLSGIAAVGSRRSAFFALGGFTSHAVLWAEEADMALFSFDLMGMPEPVNSTASTLIGAEPKRKELASAAPLSQPPRSFLAPAPSLRGETGAHWKLSWPAAQHLRSSGRMTTSGLETAIRRDQAYAIRFPQVWSAEESSSKGLRRVLSFVIAHMRNATLVEPSDQTGLLKLTNLGATLTETELLNAVFQAKAQSKKTS